MKKVRDIQILLLLFFLIAMTVAGCKKDNGVDPQTQRISDLSADWQVKSVMNDGTDVTGQFTGFSLSIDEFTYTSNKGGNAWPASGTYSFQEGTLDKISRSDGVEVVIDEIKVNSLILSFQISTLPGGRVTGITGNFTFSLTK